jgi:hypothetical protein
VTPYPLGLDAEFSPEERQAFENTVVDLGDGLEPNAASLIIGWAAHVQRLHDERLTSLAENRDVWNAHDWVGAMNIRGFAERALEVLSEDVRTKAQTVVNDTTTYSCPSPSRTNAHCCGASPRRTPARVGGGIGCRPAVRYMTS